MIKQKEKWEKAEKLIPGGVNSSTRLTQAIGPPFYVSNGKGSSVTGIDDNEYINMNK